VGGDVDKTTDNPGATARPAPDNLRQNDPASPRAMFRAMPRRYHRRRRQPIDRL